MERVCVFLGSSSGRDPAYAEAALGVAQLIARRGLGLVYGGARIGLMGVVADEAAALGVEVIGVIPQSLVDREVANASLSDLRVVGSMHERKAAMAELADGFIALPGGLGTLEELFEILTWSQLGLHSKPCGALNVLGYFDGLGAFLDRARDEGFMAPGHRDLLLMESQADVLLERLETWKPPHVEKWLDDASET
ncbi:MAG: TIGR00730 family Rossman fold protein [Solirubrobacterales bacterium]|nr:TIGR00730 family Rossman fold protein [Solirubrobacterales bacterium]